MAWRVVATPAALDAARWHGADVDVIRIAPDEALGLDATGVEVDDPDAIAEAEAGFSRIHLAPTDLRGVLAHVEWEVPDAPPRGVLLQGKIAGVPAKLVVGEQTSLVVQTCYVQDLMSRLGW
jgi:hypothetical protein